MAAGGEQRRSPKSCIVNKSQNKIKKKMMTTTETSSRKATTNNNRGSSSNSRRKRKAASPSPPSLPSSCSPNAFKPPSPPTFPRTTVSSVADLKDLASSRFRDLKSNLIDRSHSAILKDLDASQSRLHKRFKIQAQTCQQLVDEAEKDFKKISGRINESYEAMKDSYTEFLGDAQATASRVCKTTIPELSKSFEKAIGSLQSRFGLTSA